MSYMQFVKERCLPVLEEADSMRWFCEASAHVMPKEALTNKPINCVPVFRLPSVLNFWSSDSLEDLLVARTIMNSSPKTVGEDHLDEH
jgi:hypothetical protein